MRKSSKRLYRSKNRTKGRTRNIKRKTLRTRSKGGGVRKKTKRRRSLKQKNKKGGGEPIDCAKFTDETNCNENIQCGFDIDNNCKSTDVILQGFSDIHKQRIPTDRVGFFTIKQEQRIRINTKLHSNKTNFPILKKNQDISFSLLSQPEYNTYFSITNPKKFVHSPLRAILKHPTTGQTIKDDKDGKPVDYYCANGLFYIPSFILEKAKIGTEAKKLLDSSVIESI